MADPQTLRARLDSFGDRLRALANSMGQRYPSTAVTMAELVDDFKVLRRDIRLAEPAAPEPRPEPPPDPRILASIHADDFAYGHGRKGGRSRRFVATAVADSTSPFDVARVLPEPCTECGDRIVMPAGRTGRPPKRCDTCRGL